jgi:lysophospholipase L1-like esterase
VLVNVKVPRAWEQPNNEVLADGVQQYPNAVLVDWYAASAYRPELFVQDGIHLRREGQRAYADLIAAHLRTP